MSAAGGDVAAVRPAATRAGLAVRLAIAALALLAIAWLGLNLRAFGLAERGERLAALPEPTPAQAGEAFDLLEDARFLNPDVRPLLVQGALLAAHGGPRAEEGNALLERAVRREPDNVVAWGVLADATRELDPERSRAARERANELSPPVDRR